MTIIRSIARAAPTTRAPLRRLVAGVLVGMGTLAVAPAMMAGCASDRPSISGIGLGDRRIVSVDDTLELRVPIDPDTGARWRVRSFDSLYLTVVDRPRLVRETDGGAHQLFRIRADRPGETTLELEKLEPGSERLPIARFTIRIIE